MTTVSVIIPAYNHAAFVKRAIESVLRQTWQDYEIIVVDDGSKDETPTVAAQFGAAIHYIRQENQGMAATRNVGIRHASGELLSFLDDDDLWFADYLSTIVPYFRSDPKLAAIHTGHILVDSQDREFLPLGLTQTVPPDQLFSRLIQGGFFPPSTVSVRKAFLDKVGYFDETLQGCADWELWLRISQKHKFVGIPNVLVGYRIHAGGLSSSNVQHMIDDLLRAIHKHFGPPEGQVCTWPEDKRQAYGFAYRYAAFEYGKLGQSAEVWRSLKQAVSIWPEILQRSDTFFELACGDQPRGKRGKAELLDIDRNGAQMLRWLDALFADAEPTLVPVRRSAYSNAYLALAMLSDRSGHWAAARRYLLQATRANPRLLASYPVVRRLLKLCAGQTLVSFVSRVLGSKRQAALPSPTTSTSR